MIGITFCFQGLAIFMSIQSDVLPREHVRDGWPAKGDPKRSILVNGKLTSVSLEQEFWDAFREIAAFRKLNLSQLASEVSAAHGRPNFSSGIRIYILTYYQKCAAK
jgi:predicted DNA-binding ribbon-helix-helix protein